MSDLLTTKQVQTLLQVDRTTIYRMRKDGRLSAVKLGHQWRFPSQQIRDLLLDGRPLSSKEETPQAEPENLPIYCFQSIQDIFTDIITEIGAMMTNLDGEFSWNQHGLQILPNDAGQQDRTPSLPGILAQNGNKPQKEGSLRCVLLGLHYLQAPIDKGYTNSLPIVVILQPRTR
ncbi:MAG: helix-turn-helix domain-containing protein [Ardenticatenaceae bacterium]|nr:helix-turn-helix domain-containing protein [Ardenticatenaceae bacterium]